MKSYISTLTVFIVAKTSAYNQIPNLVQNDLKLDFLEKLASQVLEKVDDLAEKAKPSFSKSKSDFSDDDSKITDQKYEDTELPAPESSLLFDSFLADKKSLKSNQEIVELDCIFKNFTNLCKMNILDIKRENGFVKISEATLKIASTEDINVKVNGIELKNTGMYVFTASLPNEILEKSDEFNFEISSNQLESPVKSAVAISYITKNTLKSRSKRSIQSKVPKCSKNNVKGCGLCSVGELTNTEITAVLRKNTKIDFKVVTSNIDGRVCYSDKSCSLKSWNNKNHQNSHNVVSNKMRQAGLGGCCVPATYKKASL